MRGTQIKEVLSRATSGGEVTIHGWVRTARHSKGFSFLEVNDGSTIRNLQAVCDAILPNYESDIKHLGTGASVRITGELVDSPGKGQKFELRANAVHVYGLAPDYPLQKKGHTMEFLRSIAHLRSRSNTFGAVFRLRHLMARAIHDFFASNGFFYLQTPIITASDCEGAGAMFRVTTLPATHPPMTEAGEVDFSQDFFAKQAHLTVSGQLAAETAALALSRVYTFGPTFRAENSNTTRHLAEFWMIEPEMAFADLVDDMDLAERFLKSIFSVVLHEGADDMAFFAERIDKSARTTLEHVVENEFVRMTYTEAIEILKRSGRRLSFPSTGGRTCRASMNDI